MMESQLVDALRQHLSDNAFPEWVEEHRFHPTRQWRFDFAWPKPRVACEVEGGVWVNGRHTRAVGFTSDCEKYNEATVNGWSVLRVTADQIDNGQAVQWLQRVLAYGDDDPRK